MGSQAPAIFGAAIATEAVPASARACEVLAPPGSATTRHTRMSRGVDWGRPSRGQLDRHRLPGEARPGHERGRAVDEHRAQPRAAGDHFGRNNEPAEGGQGVDGSAPAHQPTLRRDSVLGAIAGRLLPDIARQVTTAYHRPGSPGAPHRVGGDLLR